MDDRLWWFANKIQDVFQIGTYDSPTLLEDFISNADTINSINIFLGAGSTNRLFVHGPVVDKVTLSQRQLTIHTSLPEKVELEGHILLYFIRLNNDTKLELDNIAVNVFCGVVKNSAISTFSIYLSEVVSPLLKNKTDWGFCTPDQVQQLLYCIDKCVNSLVDAPTPAAKVVLEIAPFCEDSITRRVENTSSEYLAECERLVNSWSSSIETVLTDAFEESRVHMMESNTGPMLELHRWKRRHILLTSIIEHLKTKESKAVVTTLIANKSKLLKKWRCIDISITDTANEAKDKYKYLEGLKRHMEPLCEETSVAEVMNTSLHHLMLGFKQAEAASRHYARSGFLGIILSKVSNQLVTLCKASLLTKRGFEPDAVWGTLDNHASKDTLDRLHDALSECLALHKYYKECLKSLREMLGAGNKALCPSRRGASSTARSETDSSMGNEKKRDNFLKERKNTASQGSLFHIATYFGIPISDDRAVMGSLEKLCERSQQLIEVISTLQQLDCLADRVADIGKCGVSPIVTQAHINCGVSTSNGNQSVDKTQDMHCLVEEEEQEEGLVMEELSVEESSVEMLGSTDDMEGGIHVSTYVRRIIQCIYDSLIESCNSLNVIMCSDGKLKDVFPNKFVSFVATIQRMELVLCSYVKSTLGNWVSTKNGLSVITRFSAVKEQGMIKQCLQDELADMFLSFEDDLEKIQINYEENKESPPVTHNAPMVASSVLWIRQLIHQIEEPMKIFRENKLLMTNKDSLRIIKLYNRLATTFYKFETLWLNNWQAQVEPIKSALKATLLVRDKGEKIHVNMDPKILELIQETKWLIRLECPVPEGALEVLKEENRIKSYVQRLKQNVADMFTVIDAILPAVKPVLSSQLHALSTTVQPGLMTLTWNNVNIDAYLHRITSATADLKRTNTIVQDILATQVETHLKQIPNLIFSNTSQNTVQSCNEFIRCQKELIEEHFGKLTHMITQVQAGLFNGVMSAINAANRSGCPKKTPDESLVASVLAEYHGRINISFVKIIKRSVSDLALCLSCENALFKSHIELCVPDITLSPPLEDMQDALNISLKSIVECVEQARWLTPADKISIKEQLDTDTDLQENMAIIKTAALSIEHDISNFFNVFKQFDKFWKSDLHTEYKDFMEKFSGLDKCREKVQGLLELEHHVRSIESSKKIGVTLLDTSPVKNSIYAMIRTWKYKYASSLHYHAKRDLDEIIKYRDQIRKRLTISVECLSSLSETLDLLAELSDLENIIDDTYLPVEITYQQLKDFEVQLPRSEVELVGSLREEWKMLMDLADSVRQTLMIEQKLQFEQELEKQVQSFVVEVIQFRTSFESQGPGVSNISPADAMSRLITFWKSYTTFDSKQHTLQAVQKMYGLPLTTYPDLLKTGEELGLLQTLYDLYQRYIDFDHNFNDSLWQDVDLPSTMQEMKALQMDCIKLPSKVKEWDAYHTLLESLQAYLELFPILLKLNSREIRNRHWLQVMQVTGSNFQLEASQMKLCHLLDCDLIEHRNEIEEIVSCASKELELEQRLRGTEEEWGEQVLHFSKFKNRGLLTLDTKYTVSLLEMLEDSQASLASMLTSRFIGPLKDEAASWAAKLLSVSEVIEQWLSVQNQWMHLEAVFSLPSTKKDLPQEAKRFAAIDKTWTKLMKKSYETRNVIQCCHGGEPPKTGTLTHLSEQLELCQRSLSGYLDAKRKLFPRFYYVSDTVLLAILSSHSNVEEVSRHFRAIFQNVDSVILADNEAEQTDAGTRRDTSNHNVQSDGSNNDMHTSQDEFTSFSESPLWGGAPQITALGVKSTEGEVLIFAEEVTMKENVEDWLQKLLNVTQHTIASKVFEVEINVENGANVEDYTTSYPCQVACLGFYLQWTRDCEMAISENKYDRKALHNLGRKYGGIVSRIPSLLNKSSTRDDPVLLCKLENILSLALHLKEVAEDFQKKKVRDTQDFEWLRNPRYYVEEQDIKMQVSDYTLQYGCEFVGCAMNQTIIPIRDRFTLLFAHTIQQFTGLALVAESAVTKREMAISLSSMCARFLLTFHCSNGTSYDCIGKILQGLGQEGSWGCFCQVQSLAAPTMQVLAQTLHLILGKLQQGVPNCTLFSGDKITLNPNFAVFVTITRDTHQTEPLPQALRGIFRQISVPQPNFSATLRSLCVVLGFKSGKMIADRLIMVHKLVSMELKSTGVACMSLNNIYQCLIQASNKRNVLVANKSYHFSRASSNTTGNPNTPLVGSDRRNRAPTPINITPLVRLEHALIKQTLQDSFGLRFVKEDALMFEMILKDVFAGTCDNFGIPQLDTGVNDIKAQFVQQAELAGLEVHAAWVNKAMQLYQLSQNHSTLIVAGQSAVGKSSLLSTLVNTLSYQSSEEDYNAHVIHKLVRVNPLSVGSLDKIFGHINVNGEWVDGIFTAAWRKANNFRNTSTWLVMDSPLHSSWADMLHSVMQPNRQLTLPNGDRMFMEGNLHLVFETDSVAGASPSVLLPSGMLYIEPEVLGWEPLSNTWLATRTPQDAHLLRLLFSKLAGPLLSFVTEEVTPIVRICSTGLFHTFIHLLTAMLDNFAEESVSQVKAESYSETLIERIVVFCLIWSLGGLLPPTQKAAFSDLVKSLTSCLPEYNDNNVYDYYVDEAGEWDSWFNLIPETMVEQLDHFVENIDTIRTYYLMQLASSTNQNILLTGGPATGKTNIVNRFLRAPDKVNCITRTLVYCGKTQPTLFQEVIEHTIVHRQGNIYGADGNKRLCLFVDDLNVLEPHESGTQVTNEYLRQLLDMQGIYDYEKAGKWKVIKDMTVIGAMTNPTEGSEVNVPPRLLRHFMIFNVPSPTPLTLYQTVDTILQTLMVREHGAALEQELHTSIVKASCNLLSCINVVLQQAALPGRYHYCFNIHSIVNLIKGLQRTSDSTRNSTTMMQLLWLHEVDRVLTDAVCRQDDINALGKLQSEITLKYFKELSMYEHAKPYFVTFDEYQDVSRSHHRQGMSSASHGPIVHVKPVSNLDDIRQVVTKYCQQMSDEKQKQLSGLLFSDVTLEHILQIHRVITMSRGNMLCIGSHGNNMDVMVNLASFIAGMELFNVKSARPQHFFEQARTAFRVAGSEGRQCVLLINSNIAHDEELMEKLNSALLAGEIPFLFTSDEMEGLLQSLQVIIRRDAPELLSDPIQFFTLRVKRNLRIVICIEPDSPYLSQINVSFKGLLNSCQVNWLMEWPRPALSSTCKFYLMNKHNLSLNENDTELLIQVMSNIHTLVQSELCPHPWEILASTPIKQSTLIESIKLSRLVVDKEQTHVGPQMYQQFLDYFIALYTTKSAAEQTKLDIHREALLTIKSMSESCRKMNEAIGTSERSLSETQKKVCELLEQLTKKSAALEKLKAQLGCESSLLPSLNALHAQLEDNDDLYTFLEEDYDPSLTRQQRRDNRKNKILSQLEQAVKEEGDLTVELERVEKELRDSLTKIDRACLDTIRVMPAPPTMVNSVMYIFVKLLQAERKLPEELPAIQEEVTPSEDPKESRRKTKARIKQQPAPVKTIELDKKDKKEKEQWLVIQGVLLDAQGIRDAINTLQWSMGLQQKTVELVEGLLKKAAENEGEEVLMPEITISQRRTSIDLGTSLDRSVGKIDEAAVSHASEKVGFIYKLIKSLLAYHHAFGPVNIARDHTSSLRALLEEMNKEDEAAREAAIQAAEEEKLTEEAVVQFEKEIEELQEQYELAVVTKRTLQTQCQNIREKLKSMSSLTSVLKGQREQWTTVVEQHQSTKLLLVNCILSSAFLAYCGALTGDKRECLFSHIKDACKDMGADGSLLQRVDLPDFIMGSIKRHQWVSNLLPREAQFLENTMLATHPFLPRWLLIFDSEGVSQFWLQALHGTNKVVFCSYYDHNIRAMLESCLAEGDIMVITEVDDDVIGDDMRFKDVIGRSVEFLNSPSENIKLFVSEKEVVGRAGFKLYLVCNKKPTNHSLISCMRLLNLTPTLGGFAEFFLQSFLSFEKNRLQEDQKKLGQEVAEQITGSSESESEILKCLAHSRETLLSDTHAIKRLLNMKKHHSEALENLEHAKNSEGNVLKSREAYRSLAVRAAVIYRTSMLMARINPMYQWSLSQFMPVFKSAVRQSDRTTISILLDQLTTAACLTYNKGLFPSDKTIYALAVLLEIEDSMNNVGPGEREFLVAPVSDSTAKALPRPLGPPPSKRKVFEWMTDEQWQNLQVLSHHCPWFTDVFDRINKDSAEVKWRLLCECESPETAQLPDVLDQRVTKIQHLMVIRAIRPSRFINIALRFASEIISKKIVSDNSLDIGAMVKSVSPRTPILLMYKDETENAKYLVAELALKRAQEVHSLYIGHTGDGELNQCQDLVNKAMQAGHWVHLHAVHNSTDILQPLLIMINGAKVVNSNFRLWLTCEPVPNFPATVLQSCIKICTDSPRAMEGQSSFLKDGMVRALSWITPDMVNAGSRADWVPLLHNLCLIYNLFQLRGRLAPNGWSYKWTSSELWESFRAAALEFNDVGQPSFESSSPVPSNPHIGKTVSWTALRYILGEVIYGAQVNDPIDKQVISAMLDHFITPAATKRDYEIPKTKWKIPSVCFQQSTRSNQISQIIGQIESNPPPECPEACLMHASQEGNVPSEQYFFSQLAKVYGVEQSDNDVELPGSSTVRSSANSATVKSRDRSPVTVKGGKDVDLLETANLLLQKLPRGWHKDYVYERIKRLGGLTPFTYFMTNDMNIMQSVLDEIRNTLTAIKSSVDNPTIHSPTVISVAHDLLYQKVPQYWQELAGSTVPNIGNTILWISDLVQRCSHLERALMQGRERVPCLWISIFYNPEGLLGSVMHEAVQGCETPPTNFEEFNFQTEITNRDKDHIRECPHEGIFIYGLSLYGASWERTINEYPQMQDIAPKYRFTPLPVIHVTAGTQSSDKSHNIYQCPVYATRQMNDKPLFYLDTFNETVHATKWALRGLSGCLR